MKPSDKEVNDLRLQVFLSQNGVCSRREAMRVIQDGRVVVNGEVILEPSTRVSPGIDMVAVDGKTIEPKTYTYIMLNKPAGFVTTRTDRFKEKIVYDLLPAEFKHLVTVGRLDKDTKGLLLLTNDGNLAFELTHPKFNIDKKYLVRVKGNIMPQELRRLEGGVIVEGFKSHPAKVSDVKASKQGTEFCLTIHEGRKRQVRLMVAAIHLYLLDLIRLEHGPVKLGNLKEGQWRPLTKDELAQLKKAKIKI